MIGSRHIWLAILLVTGNSLFAAGASAETDWTSHVTLRNQAAPGSAQKQFSCPGIDGKSDLS
ncbi:MAG: hypothetical protein ACK5JT_17100, partial [Hyphomicrobiaceae bacterium]